MFTYILFLCLFYLVTVGDFYWFISSLQALRRAISNQVTVDYYHFSSIPFDRRVVLWANKRARIAEHFYALEIHFYCFVQNFSYFLIFASPVYIPYQPLLVCIQLSLPRVRFRGVLYSGFN